MLQTAPQVTAVQLLDAGRRAEADGHVEVAYQFYRQTADRYAHSAEAAAAREALARLSAGWPPKIWHVNGRSQVTATSVRTPAPARRGRRARPHLRLGHSPLTHALALLVTGLGLLMLIAGSVAAPLLLWLERSELALQAPGLANLGIGPMLRDQASLIAGALALALLGLVTLALGLATRAVLDQASATRELIALERAKAGRDQD